MTKAHTIAGQIATFLDKSESGLGLTWHEAVEVIPYELILLMQRDKPHMLNDDDYLEVENELDFFQNQGIHGS